MHAHIEWVSRDCDGTFTGKQTPRMLPGEEKWSFVERVAPRIIPLITRNATVKITENGMSVTEETEEGYIHTEAHWCYQKSCEDVTEFRDLTAEAAGY